jgi:hypothetical protein
MGVDSTWQLRRQAAAAVDNAESADQLRFFLDDATGLLAAKDNVGVVTIIGGSTAVAFIHNPVVITPMSPYAAVIQETVKVDPTLGPVIILLPTAVGNAGLRINVINVTPLPTPIDLTPFGGELIDGLPTFQLNTPNEKVTIESDGVNWVRML